MKKIMFNDKYGLTQAVLEGRKTMTRRVIGSYYSEILDTSRYAKGEVIAIAQPYKDVPPYKGHPGYSNHRDLSAGWENKMFVKANLMPHFIKITNVKVERLQDCSEDDCLKEGCKKVGPYYVFPDFKKVPLHISANHYLFPTARKAFAALIDKVSGKGTWDSNPWCFCYEFKLIE